MSREVNKIYDKFDSILWFNLYKMSAIHLQRNQLTVLLVRSASLMVLGHKRCLKNSFNRFTTAVNDIFSSFFDPVFFLLSCYFLPMFVWLCLARITMSDMSGSYDASTIVLFKRNQQWEYTPLSNLAFQNVYHYPSRLLFKWLNCCRLDFKAPAMLNIHIQTDFNFPSDVSMEQVNQHFCMDYVWHHSTQSDYLTHSRSMTMTKCFFWVPLLRQNSVHYVIVIEFEIWRDVSVRVLEPKCRVCMTFRCMRDKWSISLRNPLNILYLHIAYIYFYSPYAVRFKYQIQELHSSIITHRKYKLQVLLLFIFVSQKIYLVCIFQPLWFIWLKSNQYKYNSLRFQSTAFIFLKLRLQNAPLIRFIHFSAIYLRTPSEFTFDYCYWIAEIRIFRIKTGD